MAYIQIPAFSKSTNLNNDTEFVIVVDGKEYLVSFKTLSEKFGNSPELLQEINAEIEALRNIVDALPTENPAAPIALKISDTPTIDGIYKPTETGVYPNAGGLEYDPTEGITYFIRTQGVWTKDVTPINFIPTGVVEEGNTQAVSGGEVFEKINGAIIKEEVINDLELLTFDLINASTQESGTPATSNNWIAAKIIDLKSKDKLKFSGFKALITPRVIFYSSTTTLNSLTKISHIYHNTATELIVDVPDGALSCIVAIEGNTNVGADLPNSPYWELFKASGFNVSVENMLNVNNINPDSRIETNQLIEIEQNLVLKGNGNPTNSLGVNGNLYIDLLTSKIYNKSNNTWIELVNDSNSKPFYYPNEMDFRPYPIVVNNGIYNFEDFTNIRDKFVQSDIDRLTHYYVDPVNGNDSNDGLTKATAYSSINSAISKGARVIRLLKGNQFYGRNFTLNTTDIATNEPLIIIGEEDGVYLSQSDKASRYTWTAVDNVWSAPRSTVVNIFDFNQLTNEGNPKALTRVTSLNDCKSTENSFFGDTSTVYVNTSNGLAPTSKFELVLTVVQQYTPTVNVPYVYFENIVFANSAGGSVSISNNTTAQFDTKCYIYKCKALANHSTNNFSIDNLKECWIQDCEAYDAKNDGFNYHTSRLSSGYTPMKVVEINCKGSRFGENYPTETSSNGSTVHEGISIIRMNCEYSYGRGGLIADVNDGTKSLNLNVKSNYNYATDGSSFLLQGNNTYMWLFDCDAINELSTQKAFIVSGTNALGKYKGITTYSDVQNATPFL